MKSQLSLEEELQKTMKIFMRDNSYIEVRILNTNRGTISGYFNDLEKMYSAVRRYDGKYNIFFTMNELINGIESRSVNCLKEYAKNTTIDAEIAWRRWILIDLDPVRPSGISSTDEELEQAEQLADKIRKYLSESGFSEPVTALSGNGFHLLYSINIPNNKESTELIKVFLKALNDKFSNDRVKVDTANYNSARITKLYGTMACKGDSTEERPHRRSKIISIPDNITEVSVGLIEGVIQDNQDKKNVTLKQKTSKADVNAVVKCDKSFSLEKWLEKHGIIVARTKAVDDGKCYVLEECPWNHEHSKDKGAYVIQYKNGKIIAGCHHDSCKEQGVSWESLWMMKEGSKPLPNIKKNSKSDEQDNRKESQADILLRILEESGHECFKNQIGETFVQVKVGEYPVNYSLDSEIYRVQIVGIYYKATQRSIRKDAIRQVIDTLIAKASIDGKVYETSNRFAMYEGKLYYLLADASNTVLCISENGIECCNEPPVRLIKRKSMLEQPMPLKGKKLLDLMKKYFSFASKEDEILHAVILITRLVTYIEQPIVIYTGPKGSYKSTSMEIDKRILDSSSTNISMMPKNEEDFLLALNSQDISCFDNIDNLGKSQADLLCLVLSETKAVKRKKYTDSELCEINLKSTVYMTGINLLSGRTDFLSRCIFLNTKASKSKNGCRKSKSFIMGEFEKDKPYILYEVFRVFSEAIKIYDEIGEIEFDDRLIDFIKWGYAVAEAIGYGGNQFLKAYKKNREEIDEEALASDEVAIAVILFMKKNESFSGSMTKLSNELTAIMSDGGYMVSNKIRQPNLLSTRLRELETGLSTIGIEVEIGKTNGTRFVKLRKDINRTKKGDIKTKIKKKEL